MCGGNLEVEVAEGVVTCDYCGITQTISKSRDEVISNYYNRANNLRIKCEFDRAAQTYEKILDQDNTESEAYWGIVLCRYGIEYVEDPTTRNRIPTCHRTSYEAITADADYIAAIEHADSVQKLLYEQEAKAIDEIQKNILAIVKQEKPFDVFICYKETDENGKRTIDSSIANDIYYQLTQEGLKVFYAPITLEDKLGREYEPYIFAALNSAKVMLVVGTKPEHFEAVWVRNEWFRFLKTIKNDRSKLLIPCYRDMDAYDLPDEFAHLQSQDMSKIGFISDITRGIKKIVSVSNDTDGSQNITSTHKAATESTKLTSSKNNKTFNICQKVMLALSTIGYFIYFNMIWFRQNEGEMKLLGIVLCGLCVIFTLYGTFVKKSQVLLLASNAVFLISLLLPFVVRFWMPVYFYHHMMDRTHLGHIACAVLAIVFVWLRLLNKNTEFTKFIYRLGIVLLCIGVVIALSFIYEWYRAIDYLYEYHAHPTYFLTYLLSGLLPSVLVILSTIRKNRVNMPKT